MNIIIKALSITIPLDLGATLFTYFVFQNDPIFKFLCIAPIILLLALWIPLARTINQINKTMDKQDGKCYNCNQKIMDKDTAVLEYNNHVYDAECHQKLYGHLYEERDGIWYKKDKEKEK